MQRQTAWPSRQQPCRCPPQCSLPWPHLPWQCQPCQPPQQQYLWPAKPGLGCANRCTLCLPLGQRQHRCMRPLSLRQPRRKRQLPIPKAIPAPGQRSCCRWHPWSRWPSPRVCSGCTPTLPRSLPCRRPSLPNRRRCMFRASVCRWLPWTMVRWCWWKRAATWAACSCHLTCSRPGNPCKRKTRTSHQARSRRLPEPRLHASPGVRVACFFAAPGHLRLGVDGMHSSRAGLSRTGRRFFLPCPSSTGHGIGAPCPKEVLRLHTDRHTLPWAYGQSDKNGLQERPSLRRQLPFQ